VRRVVTLCAALALSSVPLGGSAAPWLFVSDVHLDPAASEPADLSFGEDTPPALFASALTEMKRVDPAPPVVFITGDFFAHRFDYDRAVTTMTGIAHAFGAAFPHAQFVIALGNEDSDCGDYQLAPGSPFLRATAGVWAPLVDRHGAAPGFSRSFTRDGAYITALPSGVTAFVADDVYWSPRYRAGCSGPAEPDRTLDELESAFPADGVRRRWVVAHIPPGMDAFSTVFLAHGLAVIPFLRAAPQRRLLQLLADPRRGIDALIDAHTHKFSYRIAGEGGAHPVPALLVPSVSPFFGNNPSFLTVDVRADGTIADAHEHSYLGPHWRDVGGLHALGLRSFAASELTKLQARLAHDRALRATFATLYDGGASDPEVTEQDWRSYWCAATSLWPSDYRRCLGEGGIGLLTTEGVAVVAGAAAALIFVGVLVTTLVRSRRTPRRA